jgi:thiol-disulfide isomerase/thioredoxin
LVVGGGNCRRDPQDLSNPPPPPLPPSFSFLILPLPKLDFIQKDLDISQTSSYLPLDFTGPSESGIVQTNFGTPFPLPLSVKFEGAVATIVPSLLLDRMSGVMEEAFLNSKITESPVNVVVVGGGKLADYLASTTTVVYPGAKVYQVTSRGEGIGAKRGKGITCINPNKEDAGFSDIIGRFEVLVDTLAAEAEDTIELMRKKYGLKMYLTTMTRSAELFKDGGIFKGPGIVNEYRREVEKFVNFQRKDEWGGAGVDWAGVQDVHGRLMKSGNIFDEKIKAGTVNIWGSDVRDLLESTTWPRDSEGVNVRYGFPPVVGFEDEDDDDEEDDDMEYSNNEEEEDSEEIGEGGEDTGEQDRMTKLRNSAAKVTAITNLQEVSSEIMETQSNAVLFLSAPWCKACKYMAPPYKRLSKLEPEVKFLQVSISSEEGKEVSRWLGVDAVPSFVFFREGKVIGDPVSTGKLRKGGEVYTGVQLLKTGGRWKEGMEQARRAKNDE